MADLRHLGLTRDRPREQGLAVPDKIRQIQILYLQSVGFRCGFVTWSFITVTVCHS